MTIAYLNTQGRLYIADYARQLGIDTYNKTKIELLTLISFYIS